MNVAAGAAAGGAAGPAAGAAGAAAGAAGGAAGGAPGGAGAAGPAGAGVPPAGGGGGAGPPAADAAGAAAPAGPNIGNAGVIQCLIQCGFNEDAQRQGWVTEGMNTMEDILAFRPEEVYSVGADLQKLSLARGGSRQGRGNLRRLEALVRWCLERKSSGQDLDANAFTIDIMQEMVGRVRDEKDDKDGDDDDLPELAKFKPMKWVSWKLAFKTHLGTIKGIMDKLPLTYVIRKATPPDATALALMTPPERSFWTVRLSGARFSIDNKKVFTKLKLALLDTDGWTWIQSYDSTENGRGAWNSLVAHYDGPGEREKRVAQANQQIAKIHYRSEKHPVNFELYSTRLFDAFTILAQNGVQREQWEWVDALLNGIDVNASPNIIAAQSIIRFDDNLKNNFSAACNKLSEFIVKTTPITTGNQHGTRGGRQLSSYNTRGGRGRGRGGRGRGRGRGRGGRGYGNNNNIVNGVDVSDPTKQFSPTEYSRLSEANYLSTLKHRRQQIRRANESHGGGNGNDAATISSLRSTNETLEARLAAIEGALNADETNQANQADDASQITTTTAGGKTKASNGTQFGSGTYKKSRTGERG